MNIRVPETVLERMKIRAAERRQTVQDYVTTLIVCDLDAERAAAASFVAGVLERDGAWLDELEAR
ncbi:hypothetical protein Sru01_08770 [Sphaerisporangium rufum]|uniref:Toxin-antitoxin system HicB family antitoxin n=1 Tax=Sphaerisporangium rufum TaxID=1381558 RepID=A0A919QZY9_9ACTN|nr:hypothetical protein Sru01_08770 [Sphaerisporangium rufum]